MSTQNLGGKVQVVTLPKGEKHAEIEVKTSKSSEPTKKEIKTELKSVPTSDKRLSNLKVLNKLSEKVEYLRKMKENFNLFVASSDGTNEKLTLENSQGFKFTVSNSNTLNKVISLIEKDLHEVSEKAEEEFLNFNI